jgi:carbamoyl-phosphate synthase large subunit
VVIGGIMEHIEQAGIHSGDSACSLPTLSLSQPVLETIRRWSTELALALKVIGLMNLQFAVQGDQVYILEANPRASRTVPFVSKAVGIPLAKIAARLMSGRTLADLNLTEERIPDYISVKEAVLPFNKFPGTDTILGPEMRSTGEAMGIDQDFGHAYAKSQLSANQVLPANGNVFVSMNDRDKQAVVPIVQELIELGFKVVATSGTAEVLKAGGLEVESIFKLHEGRPHVLDWIKNEQVHLIINTPSGSEAQADGRLIRRSAIDYKIPIVTTLAGAKATTAALRAIQKEPMTVQSMQAYHRKFGV